MSVRPEVVEAAREAPEASGVYLFKNAQGAVLYVGKAKNLRSRVRSYLRPGGDGRIRLIFLEREAATVEFVVTPSETEALLLEDTLVKKHQPPFNVRLKDDKSFLMIRVDPKSEFPRLEPIRSRGKRDEGKWYFGPYASSRALRQTLALIQSLVPLRDCQDHVMRHRSRPCLKHQIGLCAAPCVGLIDREKYAAQLEQALQILRGRTAELERDLEKRMKDEAAALRFEKAKTLRDQLAALRETTARRLVLNAKGVERDVLGVHAAEKKTVITLLRFREGQLVDSRNHLVPRSLPQPELLSSFLARFYATAEDLPAEIVLASEPNEREMLLAWLEQKAKHAVAFVVPERGEKFQQLRMATQNARLAALQAEKSDETDASALEALRERLGLEAAPETIDCFDISEFQGAAVVASRVRFVNGRADKNGYRRYRIESVKGQDDFASMLEVVTRSLRRGVEEGDLPDLIVIDGGKGQLASALAARDEAGAWNVAIVGLAKDREKEREGEKFRTGERVFLPGAEEPIPLPTGTPELHLMQRIRDEAHRFAITYHRKKREAIRSELDEISGLGEKRKRQLLRAFGSVQGIREAGIVAIQKSLGISLDFAERIVQGLRPSEEIKVKAKDSSTHER